MKVDIRYVNSPEEESAILQVCENHAGLLKLLEIIEKESYQVPMILCIKEELRYSISCDHILYFETIQEHLFAHTGSDIYEVKHRLYEMEEILPTSFARISKSAIINLNQVVTYRPLPNGLMKATFYSGDSTYISRKYLRHLRSKIGGEKYDK